jgi:hypothetical protein
MCTITTINVQKEIILNMKIEDPEQEGNRYANIVQGYN